MRVLHTALDRREPALDVRVESMNREHRGILATRTP